MANSTYFETLFIYDIFVIFISLFVHFLLTCSTREECSIKTKDWDVILHYMQQHGYNENAPNP